MVNLPVRQMVLYKHGVGFFVRQGEVTGEKVALTFRSDEINDVLKSLAVFDQAGGQVLGVHYQTPKDKHARLASSSIRLSENSSLRDLLRDLRGRECQLVYDVTKGTQDTLTGRIIGIDEVQTKEEFSATVSILTSSGVQIIDYDSLRSVKISDDQSSHDLEYFLDTSMAEDDRRVINVRLSEGEHDLAVYYVAPSPTWRVSYRLVAETDEDGSTGTALLQGWGIFDNRLEEDLDNVSVTLVAGQPISFIYDLYDSRIPDRPFIEDESRVAPAPVEFKGQMRKRARSEAVFDDTMEKSAGGMLMAAQSAPMMSYGAMEDSTPIQSEGKATGETFQYVVTTPVSVKRGESALVPIIGKEVKYERELLYNGQKMVKHPVASLRFDNDTDLTLERGPVTIVEDGDYKGEAIIPFTKENTQVYTPYAVELGIQVVEYTHQENIVSGLNIQNTGLFEQMYQIKEITYKIENNTTKSQTVTIEASIFDPSYELYDTRQPDYESLEERRWKVTIDAHGSTEFVRKERRMYQNRQDIKSMKYAKLAEYLENQWLDKATFDYLNEILQAIETANEAQQSIKRHRSERDRIYKQQEQLRANLGTLQSTGQEASLRNRLLNQLENSQDELDQIAENIAEARQTIEENQAKAEKLISELGE